MIRRIVLAAALLAAAGRMAHAAACTPIGTGPVINGFETTGSACTVDFPQWTFTSVPAGGTWSVSPATAPYTVLQGSDFGYAAGNVTQMSLTLTTAASPAFAANNNWTAPDYNYLFVAYASSTTTANDFHFEYQFINSASVNPIGFQTAAALQGTALAPWTYIITSLNYARNIGFATTDVTQIRLVDFGPVFDESLGIAYDDLQLDPAAGTLDTPNSAVPPAQAGGSSAGCGTSFTVTWTAQTTSGTDTISGYHIYHSTAGPTGPWVSDGYVVDAGGGSGTISFTDTTAGNTNDLYYIILPYSSTTTNFGGSGVNGVFTGCNVVSLDTPWTAADGGVNEALISNADAVGPFSTEAGCSPTDTSTPSPSPSDTLSSTETSTSSPTASATPTFTETSTSSDTASATPTDTPTFSVTDTPTITNTPMPGSTNTFTPSNTFTATATFTASNTFTATATFTASNTPAPPTATFTASNTFTPGPPTPTPTPVVTQPYIQLYPNPFYPDRGQVSHLGPVPAGETWSVYDIIGKFVYKATTTGNPALDIWYGYNADGMECSTGIYFMVIKGKVYRIGLVRN